MNTTVVHSQRLRRSHAVVHRPRHGAARRPAARSVVVQVELVDRQGRRVTAVGGGRDVAHAIAFARESVPSGAELQVVGVADLYGD
jgi:hypothetical protein